MTRDVGEGAGFASFVMRARALGVTDTRVIGALEKAERGAYAADDDRGRVFRAEMLPLPCGQAMERIDDAALLLEAAGIEPEHRVLEIGTGSGFLTEALARLAKKVVTVERYRTLLLAARERHARRGLTNVVYLQRDGGGLGDVDGPFDRIVSTVAFPEPPRAFIEHLVAEGVLACPVGDADGPQAIMRLEKVGVRFDRTALGTGWFQLRESGVAHAL